jgi:hypothetical protein
VGRRVSIAILVAVVGVLLVGCRVDVAVDVSMEQNGSGTVTVTVTADADVVRAAPGLAADLRLDDLRDAGWTTDGPVGTPSGGLSIALVHTFDTPGQATALLASLNGPDGPFEAVAFTREATDAEITYRMTGQAKANGLTGFADPDLITAVGATPWVAEAEAAGVDPDEAVSMTFTVTLPGVVDETTAASDTQPLSWAVPFDDTAVDLTTQSTESLSTGRGWSVLATLSFVALGLWVMMSIVGIVLIARRQHRRRQRRRSLAALIALEHRDDDLHDVDDLERGDG